MHVCACTTAACRKHALVACFGWISVVTSAAYDLYPKVSFRTVLELKSNSDRNHHKIDPKQREVSNSKPYGKDKTSSIVRLNTMSFSRSVHRLTHEPQAVEQQDMGNFTAGYMYFTES